MLLRRLRNAWPFLAFGTVAAVVVLIGSATGVYHPLLPAALSVPILGLLLALAGRPGGDAGAAAVETQ